MKTQRMSKRKTSIRSIILITTNIRKSLRTILVVIMKKELQFQELKRNELAKLTKQCKLIMQLFIC